MLDVTYEAVTLDSGRLAAIDEDRGRIHVRVAKSAELADVVQQLNTEVDQFLATSSWYQLWKDEIISRGHSASLRVVYLLDQDEPDTIEIEEGKGIVTVHIDPYMTTAEFAAAMNPASKQFLSGGQWFQMYGGEIIDMSPEEPAEV